MIVIPPEKLLQRAVLVPEGEEEVKAIIHALIQERDRVIRAGGDHYGKMSIGRMSKMIEVLQELGA